MIRTIFWIVLLGIGSPAFAGQITGQVCDQSGASVPGAKVVLQRLSDGKDIQTVYTDANGLYTAKDLLADSTQYSIRASSSCFKTIHYGPIYAMEGRPQHLDFVLPVIDCGGDRIVPQDENEAPIPFVSFVPLW